MSIATFVAIFAGVLVAGFLAVKSGSQQNKERRLAEHKMNARLLRLDI